MELTIEIYTDKTGTKKVYIAANDGASGAEYPYNDAKDIGRTVASYLENYYPDII